MDTVTAMAVCSCCCCWQGWQFAHALAVDRDGSLLRMLLLLTGVAVCWECCYYWQGWQLCTGFHVNPTLGISCSLIGILDTIDAARTCTLGEISHWQKVASLEGIVLLTQCILIIMYHFNFEHALYSDVSVIKIIRHKFSIALFPAERAQHSACCVSCNLIAWICI